MIMENLGCNCSYFQFPSSHYRYILEFPDFKFGTKSQDMLFFRPKKFQSVKLHSIATAKMYIPLFYNVCYTYILKLP